MTTTEGADTDTAVVLTGDFNAEPTEPVFATVTGSKLGYVQNIVLGPKLLLPMGCVKLDN